MAHNTLNPPTTHPPNPRPITHTQTNTHRAATPSSHQPPTLTPQPITHTYTHTVGLMAKIKPTPWREALATAGFPDVKEEDLTPLFQYLEFCLKQVRACMDGDG
jgi:hypothetical protein